MKSKQNIKSILILFYHFFKIGILTIGGGMVMIPLIEDIAVNKKKWITSEEMLECITLSQTLPGIIAVDLAAYVGKKKHGIIGSIVATVAVILPSFFIMFFLANVLNKLVDNTYVQGAMLGLKASVCGLIAIVAFDYGKKICKKKIDYFILIMSLIGILLFKVNAVFVIIVAGVIGVITKAVLK